MCPLTLQTVRLLCCVLLTVLSGFAFAQTTGTVNPNTVTAKPKPSPAGVSADEEPPPGACMPIGVTVSGEIVFPFQCKGFIERRKAANNKAATIEDQTAGAEAKSTTAAAKLSAEVKPAVEQKPAAAETKPATAEAKPAASEEKPAPAEDKSAAAEMATEEKPAAAAEKAAAKQSEVPIERVEPVPLPLPRRVELKPVGPPGCTHFRSYDPMSGTYRAYGGQRRPCR
jgi:BA14K-like protein